MITTTKTLERWTHIVYLTQDNFFNGRVPIQFTGNTAVSTTNDQYLQTVSTSQDIYIVSGLLQINWQNCILIDFQHFPLH